MVNKKIFNYLYDNNLKGTFVENCLYDYLCAKGFETCLVETNSKKKGFYNNKNQRFDEDESIIVPDIFAQRKYKEIFFIESKSRWIYEFSTNYIEEFAVPVKNVNSYIKFYKQVFPNSNLEGLAEVYISFSVVVYCDDNSGYITCYITPLRSLFSIEYVEEERNGENHLVWKKKNIKQISKCRIIDFTFDKKTEKFYNGFSDKDILSERETKYFKIKDIERIIQQWIFAENSW